MTEREFDDACMQYAYDLGFDEGYQAHADESLCEVYVLDDGSYQCGNCGAIIVSVVEEGEE